MRVNTALLLLVISFCLACGPVFRTNYTFSPPETESGRACIFQCENNKLQCEQLEDAKVDRCEAESSRDYERCERNKEYQYDYGKGREKCVRNCYCSRRWCSKANYERCAAKYRSCYQTCGGLVHSETVCVRNCEQR